MSQQVPPVLLAGGGSAGHVSPMLAIADALKRRDPDAKILALGTEAGMESRLVPLRGYELATVPKVPMPRRLNASVLRFPGSLVSAVSAAGRAIDQVGAKVVVGMGGYVSTPAYLAARRRNVPIVIHEQNALPGMANKLGARFSKHVMTTFPTTQLPGAQCVGMPMRNEITSLDRAALRAEGQLFFELAPDKPTLVVTGGSLGAQRINEAVSAARGSLAQAGIQVLHITGKGKADTIAPADGPAPYRVVEYVDRMDLAYAVADLMLCRSGANTVCELTALGLPAVYVPLPIGNGEQRFNAEPVVAAGGGLLVADDQLSAEWLGQNLVPLVKAKDQLQSMSAAAAEFGTLTADELMVDVIIAAAAGERYVPVV